MAGESENNLIRNLDILSSTIDFKDLMAYMVASKATQALGSRILEVFIAPMESEFTTSANVRVTTYDLFSRGTIRLVGIPTQARPKTKAKPKPSPPPLPRGAFPLPENFLRPRLQ